MRYQGDRDDDCPGISCEECGLCPDRKCIAGNLQNLEWISIEDELPPLYEDVLTWRPIREKISILKLVDRVCVDWEGCNSFRPTHWARLPEPPE